MIKLTGICVIFLAARLIYEAYAEKTEMTLKNAENIILFADLLYVNIMELKMPLETAVSMLKFRISPFIDEFTEKFLNDCRKHPHLSVRENFLNCFSKINADKRIKREINRFFEIVGNSDKEIVLSYKNIAVRNCEEYLSHIRRNSESRCKAAGALTAGMSALLIIILI